MKSLLCLSRPLNNNRLSEMGGPRETGELTAIPAPGGNAVSQVSQSSSQSTTALYTALGNYCTMAGRGSTDCADSAVVASLMMNGVWYCGRPAARESPVPAGRDGAAAAAVGAAAAAAAAAAVVLVAGLAAAAAALVAGLAQRLVSAGASVAEHGEGGGLLVSTGPRRIS